jgi:IPT/TIG domain
MKRIFSVILSAVLGLTSCTTFLPEHNATVNVDAITFAILTELYCAASQLTAHDQQTLYFASDDWWVAGIDMYLSASIEASANPTVSLLGPFNLAKAAPFGGTVGSFTSVFSGSVDEIRTNMREYKIYVYLKRLVNGISDKDGNIIVPNWKTFAEQNRWPVHCENPNAGGTYLQGQLGLEDWLAPAVLTQEASVRYAPLNAPPANPPPPAPTITDVFPSQGSYNDMVTITGTNLSSVTKIIFNNNQYTTKDPKNPTNQTIAPRDEKTNPDGFVATPTTIQFYPLKVWPTVSAGLTVQAPGGDATSTFTVVPPPADALNLSDTDKRKAAKDKLNQQTSAGTVSPSSGAQQSPTISGTFTFTIKSTGTIGPSFALTRVSGGAGTLFTASRSDNSYVTIALTAAYYCPLSTSLPVPKTCAPTTPTKTMQTTLMTQLAQPREPNADQLSAAIYRIDAAILNQNLAKIAAPQ